MFHLPKKVYLVCVRPCVRLYVPENWRKESNLREPWLYTKNHTSMITSTHKVEIWFYCRMLCSESHLQFTPRTSFSIFVLTNSNVGTGQQTSNAFKQLHSGTKFVASSLSLFDIFTLRCVDYVVVKIDTEQVPLAWLKKAPKIGPFRNAEVKPKIEPADSLWRFMTADH